jgi:hypothetical protein
MIASAVASIDTAAGFLTVPVAGFTDALVAAAGTGGFAAAG